MIQALFVPSTSRRTVLPPISEARLSTALPRRADDCYDLFIDVERIPEWLTIVRSAVITGRDAHDRARDVAFLARLERATIGYTCHYRYESGRRRVDWATSPESAICVAGYAEFAPLGERACLMTYALDLQLGNAGALPGWSDPMFEGHAASASLSDFRDFVMRSL